MKYNIKNNKYLLLLILATLVFIIFIFFTLKDVNKNHQLITQLENSFIFTKNNFEEQKKYTLSLATLLAQDKEIIHSFKKGNKKETFDILNKKIKTFKQFQNSDFKVLIYNKNLTTYVKNWVYPSTTSSFKSSKRGLLEVRRTKKSITSIELGKKPNIRAIAPIFLDNKYIGSIKVIISFDQLAKKLKQKGLSIFILLNNKYLNIADELKYNRRLNGFTIVNQYGQNISGFKNLDFNALKDFGYFSNEESAISYFSFYSCKREKLGYILVSSKNDSKIEIKKDYEKKLKQKVNGIILE